MAASTSTGSPAVAVSLTFIAVGSVLMYSAFKGVGIVEAFSGKPLPKVTPVPGPDTQTRSRDAGTTTGTTGTSHSDEFKGTHADQLARLAWVAENTFHLTITQINRPMDATYGAPNSNHKYGRAFDATGTVADRIGFARFAKSAGADEVFCDQAGMVAPGYDHSDHVHVGYDS